MIPRHSTWIPVAILTVLGLYAGVLVAYRRRRDRQWAAGMAERVRIAGILGRMEEDDLADLEPLAMLLDEGGQP